MAKEMDYGAELQTQVVQGLGGRTEAMNGEKVRLIWLPTFADNSDQLSARDNPELIGRVLFSRYSWWQWQGGRSRQSAKSAAAASEHDAEIAAQAHYLGGILCWRQDLTLPRAP